MWDLINPFFAHRPIDEPIRGKSHQDVLTNKRMGASKVVIYLVLMTDSDDRVGVLFPRGMPVNHPNINVTAPDLQCPKA